ncbi:MAG: hypothetical protein V4671_15925 [Armatimonadota bacterium]
MTRGEMIGLSDQLLLAAFGSPFASDPFTPGTLLDVAADEVCKKTGCFYDVQPTNLVADQALYCAPTIYQIKDIYITDADGNTHELIARTPAEMTRQWDASWRDVSAIRIPDYLVYEGTTRVRLAPRPLISEGSVVFEGFATTTSKVTGSALHLWPNETDECPLPEDGQMAVVYKLCALRCMQFLGNPQVPEALLKMQAFEAQYKSERGDLERNTTLRYPRGRLGPAFARSF